LGFSLMRDQHDPPRRAAFPQPVEHSHHSRNLGLR
jgi:hypothetical protein